MSEGFLLIDRRTNLLSCNASALRLLGAPRSCAGESVLLRQRRVDFIYPADYREGTELESTVKQIIRKMAVSQQLSEEHARQLRNIHTRE